MDNFIIEDIKNNNIMYSVDGDHYEMHSKEEIANVLDEKDYVILNIERLKKIHTLRELNTVEKVPVIGRGRCSRTSQRCST
eukprot:UN26279